MKYKLTNNIGLYQASCDKQLEQKMLIMYGKKFVDEARELSITTCLSFRQSIFYLLEKRTKGL